MIRNIIKYNIKNNIISIKKRNNIIKYLSTKENIPSLLNTPRDKMEYDVLLIGGGPASLASAIHLKQLCIKNNKDISVCIIEKGSEIGSHILSGNVFETRALDEFLPEWRKDPECPIKSKVTQDKFVILPNDKISFSIPTFLLPEQQHNDKNYVISLSQLVRYLGKKAEGLGVEIYPGFSASEVLYDNDKDNKKVIGIATKDMGIDKNGKPKDNFTRGVEIHAKINLFGEGCRGSCSEEIMSVFNLRKDCEPQTYGLGLKEIWKIKKKDNKYYKPGFVQHTLGWPLQTSLFDKTFGGSFLYQMESLDDDNDKSEYAYIHIGIVVGLDYENPYLNPYEEFQRFKTHPEIRKYIEDGECVSYGARCLNEGGYHSIPKLTFPGGALIGCSAGFLNSVKIKGTHTAMKSGLLAAEAAFNAITNNDNDKIKDYEKLIKDSWIYEELKMVRNCHSSFHYGLLPGLMYSGLSAHLLKGREPWTIKNNTIDALKTKPASDYKDYIKNKPLFKPDNKITFDLLTNLQRSGTNHVDQPAHLVKKKNRNNNNESLSIYDGPEQRFCPAKVYEYQYTDNKNEKSLVINAQNCVHCKCCSIKTPNEFIKWTVPEGGGGPNYELM